MFCFSLFLVFGNFWCLWYFWGHFWFVSVILKQICLFWLFWKEKKIDLKQQNKPKQNFNLVSKMNKKKRETDPILVIFGSNQIFFYLFFVDTLPPSVRGPIWMKTRHECSVIITPHKFCKIPYGFRTRVLMAYVPGHSLCTSNYVLEEHWTLL